MPSWENKKQQTYKKETMEMIVGPFFVTWTDVLMFGSLTCLQIVSVR